MLAFTLAGCRIELHFSCFALLCFCILFAGADGSAAFLPALILHESAHLAVMAVNHCPPKAVSLSALGCRVMKDPARSATYLQSAWISLIGPFANLFAFTVLFAFGLEKSRFGAANLVLGVFHLLPIEPLDGGLALRALLCRITDVERAQKLVFTISLLLLFPLAVLGFLLLLSTRYNFSLLALSIYLMLYLVLKQDFFLF